MANIKLVGNNWEAEGIFDKTQNKTQKAINSEVVSKLDGIEAGAQVNRTYTATTGKPTANQTPSFGGTATISQVTQDTTGQISVTDRTIKIPNSTASPSAAGLMSAADKTALDTAVTNIGDISNLETTATDLVGAANELKGSLKTIKDNQLTPEKNVKTLIIGDSYTFGWNGASVGTHWTDTLIDELSLDATIFANRGSGFDVGGNSQSIYPDEKYIDLLNRAIALDIDFKLIIIQCGVNDIQRATSLENLETAIDDFFAACKTAFPNAKLFCIPLYSVNPVGNSRRIYTTTIDKTARNNGAIVPEDSANWFIFKRQYLGNDADHLSSEGYALLGRYITQVVKDIKPTWEESYSVTNITNSFMPTEWATTNANNTFSLYGYGRKIGISIKYIIPSIKSPTPIAKYLPPSIINYQTLNIDFPNDPTIATGRSFIEQANTQNPGNIYVYGLTSAAAGKEIRLMGAYESGLNYE